MASAMVISDSFMESVAMQLWGEHQEYLKPEEFAGVQAAEQEFFRQADRVRAEDHGRAGSEVGTAAMAETSAAEPQRSGLALSGGGIRSASFSIGVLQALVSKGWLSRFDYLSTVSGGGYAGMSLSWWLHRGLPTVPTTNAGTGPDSFPFGARPRREGPRELSEREQAQNGILDFIRYHASYLNPTPRLHMGSFIAVVIRAASVSLFVHFMLLCGIFGILINAKLLGPPATVRDGVAGPEWLDLVNDFGNAFVFVGLTVGGFLFTSALIYSLWTFHSRGTLTYRARTNIQAVVGRITSLGCAILAFGLVPQMHAYLQTEAATLTTLWRGSDATDIGWENALVYGVLSTVAGALLGAQEGKAQASGTVYQIVSKVRAPLAVIFVCYGLLIGAYAVAFRIHTLSRGLWGPDVASTLGPAAAVLLMGLILGWFTNINYMGVHRMYRDRLMELFTPNHKAIRERRWTLASEADSTGIHDLCGLKENRPRRPYHLVNTNVVLVDSLRSKFRGRGGDSFLLSPLYCGSEATGWKRSDRYMNAENGRGMSIASAMAVSGAALNPHTGVGGAGPTRSRLVSLILSLLNLRLGYWAPNPSHEQSVVPNFILPGLKAALSGKALHEATKIIELTDGGHYENLGVYELLRRRLSLIVVCDAGADPAFEFADLANLVERARADFGAKIYFPEEHGLGGLVPRAQAGNSLEDRLCIAERGFAVGRIRYHGDSKEHPSGRIVFLKTTLIKDLPPDVVGYKLAHPLFPDESTGDQFFDETQFEAYRELGYRIGEQWLEHEAGRPMSDNLSLVEPHLERVATSVLDGLPVGNI
jgi:Patatin-like phospholipase